MNIRWIALGCIMQGAALEPILQRFGFSQGVDFETAIALLVVGLIVEAWPGKRWSLK